MKNIYFIIYFFSVIIFCIVNSCTEEKDSVVSHKKVGFLNHGDSATYVGNTVCGGCHGDKLQGFMHTGMGLSFAPATRDKSVANFTHEAFYDSNLDFYYKPFWKKDSLVLLEYRLDGNDTIHSRVQTIDYIIGSGHHTNSHLFRSGGYLFQAPATWYVQKQKWDLPPGFEMGGSSRFSRKIGNECITCHNDYPQTDPDAINHFSAMPSGISCERCHGPGSIHVRRKMAGEWIDTSKTIDYSIVNPGKLEIGLQFELCQRCHLQGNAVLADGKSFYDFLPGKKLSDVVTIFLPRFKGDDDHFIMASHADRIKQSACFTESNNESGAKELRPYRKGFTCVTCHNPHQSVRETGNDWFNSKCRNCHGNLAKNCSEKDQVLLQYNSNCVSCHMPVSGSVDIPHVSIHDHYIRKPKKGNSDQSQKIFAGLVPVNHANPDKLTWIKAYLNQYEKFDKSSHHLDSAFTRMLKVSNKKAIFNELIRYHFLKQDFPAILLAVKEVGMERLLNGTFFMKDAEMNGAWTTYRIGEAYYVTGQFETAMRFFSTAVKLAKKVPEFQNKLAATYYQLGNQEKAKEIYKYLNVEHPYFALSKSNYAFMLLQEGKVNEADKLSMEAIILEPDNESVVFNRLQFLVQANRRQEAKKLLMYFLKKNPGNQRGIELSKLL